MSHVENGRTYRVDFEPDLVTPVARGDFFLTETIKAPDSAADPDAPEKPEHAAFDGDRLVMTLGPDATEDDTYSTVEVSSTRRFDQQVLTDLHQTGSPRPVIPGRQAVYRDVVFAPQFADGRAVVDPVTTGVTMQTWRGIEDGGLDFSPRPEFVIATFAYIGGKGLMPRIMNGFGDDRPFAISVVDFRVGVFWFQKLKGTLDPAVPHDLAIRWLPNHDVSFTVDGKEVGLYRDGKVRAYPLKLRAKQFWRGTDLFGHRYVTPDPCHIDVWINSSCMGSRLAVPNGKKFTQELWVALAGFGVEPV